MDAGFLSRGLSLIIGRGALLRFGGVMDSIIIFSAMGGDAMRLTERIKKRRADFWAALGDDGNNGIEELLKLYWWWGSDTADFFFDKFVPAGLRLENLEVEKKNAIGTMQTAVRDDVTQLSRLLKAQRRDSGQCGRRSLRCTACRTARLRCACWPARCRLRNVCGTRSG